MTGIVLRPPGGLDRLELVDLPDPDTPGPGEIRVRLHASSLDDHDYAVVTGTMPTADGRVLMSDGASVVEVVGEGVAGLKVGDHVVSWMHHCNIDRLIAYGYAKSAGREYPTAGTAWTDAVFTYTDLLGQEVTGKVRDVPPAPDLGCRYPLITPRQPPAPSAARVAAAVAEAAAVRRGTASGRTLRARVEELVVPPTAAAAGAGPDLTLQLADVFLPAGRGVHFEVYANLPAAGVAPDPEGPQFVGILGAFGNVAEDNPMGDHGHDMGGPATHTFDLSAAAAPAILDAVTITLVPVSTDPLPQRVLAKIGAATIYRH